MSDIRLGWGPALLTSYKLPVLRYVGGAPAQPMTIEPQTEEATMSDGNKRWAFFESKFQQPLAWGYLTYDELKILLRLVAMKQVLYYRNQWIDTTWHSVVIVSFSYEFIDTGIKKFKRFKAEMTLREA